MVIRPITVVHICENEWKHTTEQRFKPNFEGS